MSLHNVLSAILQWFSGLWALVTCSVRREEAVRFEFDADIESRMSTGKLDLRATPWAHGVSRTPTRVGEQPIQSTSIVGLGLIGVQSSPLPSIIIDSSPLGQLPPSNRVPANTSVSHSSPVPSSQPATPPLTADSPALSSTSTPPLTPTSPLEPRPVPSIQGEKEPQEEHDIAESITRAGASPPLSKIYPSSLGSSTPASPLLLSPSYSQKAAKEGGAAYACDPFGKDGTSYVPTTDARVAMLPHPDAYDFSAYCCKEWKVKKAEPSTPPRPGKAESMEDASMVCDVVLPLTPLLESKTLLATVQVEEASLNTATNISPFTPKHEEAAEGASSVIGDECDFCAPIVPLDLAISPLPSDYTLEAIFDDSAPPIPSSSGASNALVAYLLPSFASWLAEFSHLAETLPEPGADERAFGDVVELPAHTCGTVGEASHSVSQLHSSASKTREQAAQRATRGGDGEEQEAEKEQEAMGDQEREEPFYMEAIREEWRLSDSINDILSLLEKSFESSTTEEIFRYYEGSWEDSGGEGEEGVC